MVDYVLGLDLGSNSVGWALVSRDGQALDGENLVKLKIRVFPTGVDQLDTKRERPRGQERRLARSQRRLHERRNRRRQGVRTILQGAGLLPRDHHQLAEVLAQDPYQPRKDGLDGPLTPHQFGRALYHLAQRRGFKSNRKQENTTEDGKVAKAVAELQEQIGGAGCRTLGEYLATCRAKEGDREFHCEQDGARIRNQYTLRAMYEEEFRLLWEAQRPHHPELLTEELRRCVHRVIFYQRPIWWDKGTIGDCELEPGEKRCPRAHWLGQQFRLLQEINLLTVVDGDEERPLTAEERRVLRDALTPKRKLTFDRIRSLLGFLDSQTFNLEEFSKRDYLSGNPVEASLRAKALRGWYDAASPALREQVYDALAEIEDEDELRALAAEQWGLDDAQLQALLKISLPTGRFALSRKAIRKIMPHLEAGEIFSKAKELAGYALSEEVATCPLLPPVDEAVATLTNPLVHRALTEMRKVVNAIARRYGPPAEIVVELARDMKNSAPRRREIFFENRKRRDENDGIRTRLIQEFGQPSPSRDDVLRYRLWEECGKTCVYTGKTISKRMLLSGEVQIDHVLPYSRTLDDSYMNKVLCFADENRTRKANKTPREAYGQDPERYEAILQRAARLPFDKRRKFTQKELDLNTFVERQLNDTRYMSRLATRYLKALGSTVRSVKGQTTAELRRQWGLDGMLDAGAAGKKTRDDHRHHAVDAVIIAQTTRGALQKLSTVKYAPRKVSLDPPWESFRHDVEEAVNAINVSHAPTRKLAGKLHEDTAYGPGDAPGAAVLRVPVGSLTPKMIPEIRDPAIRELVRRAVEDACRERGVELSGGDKVEKVLGDTTIRMPSGVPVRKVRIQRMEKTLVPVAHDPEGRPIKFVKPGGNHHVEIYQRPDGAWTGRAVSRFEAHQRRREGKPVVDRTGPDGAEFVMSLCINDMVECDDKNGRRRLYRVQNTSTSSPLLVLRLHTATRTDDKDPNVKAARRLVAVWKTFQSWDPRKVTVDLLGEVRPCND